TAPAARSATSPAPPNGRARKPSRSYRRHSRDSSGAYVDSAAEAFGRRRNRLRILIGGSDEFCDRVAAVGLHLCDFGGGRKLHLPDVGGENSRDERASIHDAYSSEPEDRRRRLTICA